MEVVRQRVLPFLRMIKIAHSVFALPFAFTGALLAAGGIPDLAVAFWIAVAMVGARSGAMGVNRIVDRHIDAENPRTMNREIPKGAVSLRDAIIFTVISFSAMVYAAYSLNPLCFALSPVAIVVLVAYSYTKRFTWLSHFILGVAIAGAPLGAWIAVRGSINPEVLPLVFAVIFWLAGFDVLYALQDINFDRRRGLHSIPQRFGVKGALVVSRSCHAVTCLLLGVTGVIFSLGSVYWVGMIAVAGLLIYEHSLVKSNDLSKLNIAFFNMNGYVSITVFLMTLVSLIEAV